MKTFTALTITACAALFAGGLAAQTLAPPPPAAPPPPTISERPAVSVTVSARASRAHNELIPPATADGVRLSLRDAITLALANNVDLDVSIAGTEQGFFGVMQQKGIFDPLAFAALSASENQQPQSSLFAGGLAVDTKTYVGDVGVSQLIPWGGVFTLGFDNQKVDTTSNSAFINPAYSSSLFLALKQPLLRNFGHDVTTRFIRLARTTEAIDNQNYLQTLQQGITTVETAYWNLVYARANLEVKKESRDLAQELYRITKIKIDVGSQAPIDIVQTEAGVAQRELDIITANQSVGDAEDQLKRLLNFAVAGRWNDRIIPTDEVRVTTIPVDVDAGVERALQDRPEIRSAIFNASSARINYDFAHNQLLPQADLNAQYGYSGLGGPFHVLDANGNPSGVVIPGDYSDALTQIGHRDFKNWTVGVNLSFPILNRTARGAEGVARWGLQSSLATLEQVRQNVTVQVRNAGRAIETARESIVAAGKSRELQERNVDAAKKKYDNGLITAFEVLSVQNDLATARSAELQALTQYRDAMVAYHQAIGDLLAWKDIQIEGLVTIPAPDPESLRPGK